MTELQLKKNKQTAAALSLGIFGVLFIVMYFFIVFVAMNPPLGTGSGVHLNLGFADEGSGDIQPDDIGNDGKSNEPTVKSEAQSPPPQETESAPAEETKTEPKEEASDMTSESQEESPVTAPPEKKKEEPKKVTPEKVEKPKEKEPAKPQLNPAASYDPNAKKSSTASTTGEGKTGQGGNEGDDKGKTGDKGDPRGVKEGTVYEGNPGKGGPGPGGDGGFGLAMSGWSWDEAPNKPRVEDNESGFVVFQIKVDANGDITSCTKIESTLSPETVQRCKDKILERSFVRTAGGTVPRESIGTVRFELKVR